VNRLQLAIDQIVFARDYTLGLLEQTPQAEWFRQPPGEITHVAWQVCHLAYAEYRLGLLRIRGEQSHDAELFSPDFVRLFGPNSVPSFDPANDLAPAEIRATLDRVHARVLEELSRLDDAELDQAVLLPHPTAKTMLLALLWCAHHEMLHAGQIGLLRRLLGHAPIW
jgi:uncharacterized damage-inducible protein DinB